MEKIYSRNPEREEYPYSRARDPISLTASLQHQKDNGQIGIIAEFKRLSPSGFINKREMGIREYFTEISAQKPAGFSVLTEPDHFLGNYDDLAAVQDFSIPLLDKDFISDEKMVRNAYNAGADTILLIMDFLDEEVVYQLADFALKLGMESLIEFHDLHLAEAIRPASGRLFGYNRRNLRTLEMEPQEEKLVDLLGDEIKNIILESGIDTEYLRKHDVSRYRGLLIGASILRGDNVLKTMNTRNP